MIDTKLRKYAQSGFDTAAKRLYLTKLHPNHITIFGFLVGMVSVVCLSYGYPVAALILLWVSGALDVLDGTVARLTQKKSQLGAYLDVIFDRMVEVFLILGFYFLKPEFVLSYFVFFIASMFNFTTFMLAGALFPNTGKKSMHYDGGLVERTETFLVFSLMMLFPAWIFISLNIFNALMIITGLYRMVRIIRYERKKGAK